MGESHETKRQVPETLGQKLYNTYYGLVCFHAWKLCVRLYNQSDDFRHDRLGVSFLTFHRFLLSAENAFLHVCRSIYGPLFPKKGHIYP